MSQTLCHIIHNFGIALCKVSLRIAAVSFYFQTLDKACPEQPKVKLMTPKHNLAQKMHINGQWHWKFDNWISKGYPYLEERPWTPQIIGGKLCFSARLENNKWKVIWGDEDGQEYDDVFDITEFKQTPLYIAGNQNEWFLVHGTQESQRFPFQITYRIIDDRITIFKFPYSKGNELSEFTMAKDK